MEDRVLVIDAGTGIRALGRELVDTDKSIYVLLTHVHSDHIEGFPFFKPLYEEGRSIHLVDHRYQDTHWSLVERFDGFHFPLESGQIPASIHRIQSEGVPFLNGQGFDLTQLAVNHPGGAYGYRITSGGRTLVHIPDNEIDPPGRSEVRFHELVAFCRGAEILIHDAQYVQEDLPQKAGWGHSILEDACQLAREADVDHLVFFHHDPERTDDALDAMEKRGRRFLAGTDIECTAAYEGLTL